MYSFLTIFSILSFVRKQVKETEWVDHLDDIKLNSTRVFQPIIMRLLSSPHHYVFIWVFTFVSSGNALSTTGTGYQVPSLLNSEGSGKTELDKEILQE